MNIGIDARFYGTLGKGLGRYTQKLIEHLEVLDEKNTYVIFLRKENFDEYTPKNDRFTKVLVDIPWYSWKEQVLMPLILRKYSFDLVHFPHFNVPILYFGNFVITVHDLILLHYPTLRATTLNPLYYWFKFLMYKGVLRWALFRAKHIITVSNYAKKDILKYYKIHTERVSVTYESNSELLAHDAMMDVNGRCIQILRKYGIMEPCILYVGNAYPHKNLARLVRAFHGASVGDRQLVLVGRKDHFYEQVVQEVKEGDIRNVVFTDMITDEELECVYRHAHMYVFPSLYEGFGLPPLEAMARRVPIASSDRTSMPEILGDAAHYFDPEDEDSIRRSIEQLHDSDELRRECIARGEKRVKKYSWATMVKQTKKIYQIAAKQRKIKMHGHSQKEKT